MINPPKNHHFVPKCYLNLFTNSQKKFWKKRKDNNRISETNPSKVCYEEYGNRFRTVQALHLNNLSDEYYIEKNAFKLQENNYDKILNPLIKFQDEPKVVNKDQYHLLLETLLTIKRRNPSSRNEILEGFREGYKTEEGVQLFLKFLSEETEKKTFSKEEEQFIRSYLVGESQNPDRLHDMYLSAFINRQDYDTIPNLTRDLYALKQYILFAPINQHFITSDNPGFLITNGHVSNLSGFGGNFEFYFPLSPHCCLYLKSSDLELESILQKTVYNIFIDKAQVNSINKNTQLISRNYLLAFSKRTLEAL